ARAGITCLALALGLGLGVWRGEALPLPTGPDSASALVGRGEVRLVGTVVDDPRPRGRWQQVVLEELAASPLDGHLRPLRGRLLASLPRSLPVAIADRVAVVAEVEQPEAFDGFDYPAYLARQGISGLVRARGATVLSGTTTPGPAQLAGAARSWLLNGLNGMIPEPEAALGAGILLGVRSGIAPEVADAFATAGLTHVVAISGWNIAIVAAIVASLARPLERRRGGRWLSPAAAGAAIGSYVILTGASPSVVRAALMAGAMLVARLGGSRAHAASALALAALLMLLTTPSVLWDVGFQLSALATMGLILFGASIESRLAGWPAWLREPVALTLAAQLTTLPVAVGSFERLSLVAPAANVVVVPLVPIVMLLCAIAAPVGAIDAGTHIPVVGDAARWALGGTAWLALRAMILAGQAAASVPLASLPFTAPAWLGLAWYPAVGLLWRRTARGHRGAGEASPGDAGPDPIVAPLRLAPRRAARFAPLLAPLRALARPWVGLAGVALLLVAITFGTGPDGMTHVVALDIGQGDAILITSPSGGTVLIDGGPDPDLLLRRLGEHLPWWQRRIDVMILTHPHEDHVAGLLAALQRYNVGLILEAGRDVPSPTYARFRELARAEPRGRVVVARAEQRLKIDAATTLTILYPAADDVTQMLPDSNIHNANVVALLHTGGFSALFTGDAEARVEELLAGRGLLQPIDVLKVGHHGSNTSSGATLLRATRPQVALISLAAGNDYGHPHQVTLDHLGAIPGLRLHRTDLEGSIEVISDGRRFAVHSDHGEGPWRLVAGLAIGVEPAAADGPMMASPRAASIAAWRFPASPMPSDCSPRTGCPTGSWSIRAASAASRPRRRGCSRRRGWRSIRSSSRSPPSCTTSTSSRREIRTDSTAWWLLAGSPSRGIPSWPSRSPPTRWGAWSIRSERRVAGHRSAWRSPTGTWRRAS
ncbi:MAG: ComEC/Rec2 family competence protein, partial [Chloroflexota bacterium]